MKVKDFIEVLYHAPQDAEIFCEDYYSSQTPLGSVWLSKDFNRLIVSQYYHSHKDIEPNFYLLSDFNSSFY